MIEEMPSDGHASGAPDESDYNGAAHRWLRMRRELQAAKDEARAWKDEAISHRRRLGLPVTDLWTRRVVKPEDIARAIASQQEHGEGEGS